MYKHGEHNLELISKTVEALGELAEEVVLVGGAATALLITDTAAPDVRPTVDIDVIVEVSSRTEHYRFCERLRGKGFVESVEEGVICRWHKQEMVLDVMPTNEKILGFSNRWYIPAMRHARRAEVHGARFWTITAPYFLGTKFEAFHGRGKNNFLSSHDMEDIITVLDGCEGIVEEIAKAEGDIVEYLSEHARTLLEKDPVEYVITGHLPPDPASQGRAHIVREKLRRISVLTSTAN